jgi:hypothetical protein
LCEIGQVRTIAGGKDSGSSDGKGNTAQFRGPFGITIDGVGNMAYISDRDNSTIRSINLDNNLVTTLCGHAQQQDHIDGIGAMARLNHPLGIIHHSAHRCLYVSHPHCIRRVTLPLGNGVSLLHHCMCEAHFGFEIGEVSTIAGSDVESDNDGIGSTATFCNPTSLTIIDNGISLLCCDRSNDRIRRLMLSSSSSTTPKSAPATLVKQR